MKSVGFFKNGSLLLLVINRIISFLFFLTNTKIRISEVGLRICILAEEMKGWEGLGLLLTAVVK